MNINSILEMAEKYAWEYGPKILVAAIIYFVGSFFIKKISIIFKSILVTNKIDASLSKFFGSAVDIGLKIVLFLIIAGSLGFETTSFIAIFSALTLAIGFALQGSLGNFASGVLILLFKPYKLGDLITVDDKSGVVDEIQIFNTILITSQGKKIIIPNGKITEGPIENITSDEAVRVDILIDVMDNTDFQKLKPIIQSITDAFENKLSDKSYHLAIIGFPKDAMTLEIGCWTTGEHYWKAYYYLFETVKEKFDQHNIVLSKEDHDDED
ncbi:MAG: mechanosensitive ion channel [Saprospiraceae bacterium]|nr:mechanosensitive ion channel [Saprospiraceae bacterium]